MSAANSPFGDLISPQEQVLTEALCHFQGYFYYHFEDFLHYLQISSEQPAWENENADQFYNFIKGGISNGVLQKADSKYAFLKIHPLFRYYAQALPSEGQRLTEKNQSFCGYYFLVAQDLYQRLTAEDEAAYSEAMLIIDYEIENLLVATLMASQQEDQMLIFTGVLHYWFRHNNRLETALSFYKRIHEEVKSKAAKPLEPLLLNVIGMIGSTYMELRQFEQARTYFQEALDICKRKAFAQHPLKKELMVGFYANLGTCAASRKTAISWYRKAFQLAEQAQLTTTTVSQLAYNLSEALFLNKDYGESRKYLERVQQAAPSLNDPLFRVKIHRSTAMHALLTNDYEEAEEALQQALAIAQSVNDDHLSGELWQELAALYFKKGSFEKALETCQEGLALHIHSGDQFQQANALNLLAAIAFKMQNFTDGVSYAQAAITHFNELQDYGQMAQAFTNIALSCFEMRWYEEGLTELDKAIFLLQKIEDETTYFHTKLLASCFLLALERLEEAEQEITDALHFFDQKSDEYYLQFAIDMGGALMEHQCTDSFKNLVQELMAKWQLVPNPDIPPLLLSSSQLIQVAAYDRD